MSFQKLLSRSPTMEMGAIERKNASILIVDTDQNVRISYRQGLSVAGFTQITEAADPIAALQKFEQRSFTHVLFEAKRTTMPAKDFVAKMMEYDSRVVAIASSFDPTLDDVFDLLIQGARGYLVKPFTSGSLDEAIVMATKGEPISDAILNAKDRNEALAAFVLTSLDKLAVTMRQAEQFETAQRALPKAHATFRRAVDVASTFAHGGPLKMREAIVEFCIERGNGPATRLGRLRQRLKGKKEIIAQPGEEPKSEATP